MKMKISMAALTVLVMAITNVCAGSVTSYTQKVDAEAAKVSRYTSEKIGKSSQEISALFDANRIDIRHGKLPENLSRDDLEKLLKDNFMGSYIFYQRLNETARQEVYRQYQISSGLDHLRAAIIRMGRKPLGDS